MATAEHLTELPPLPSALRGLLGPAAWRELRAPIERRVFDADRQRLDALLPPGAGRPVVLVPGYLAGDTSMREIDRWLSRGGYAVSFAKIGRNVKTSSWAAERIVEALELANASSGRPVIVIGHSRGGQEARVAVARRTDLVDRLITLGSPVRHHLPRSFPLRSSIEGLRLLARSPIGPNFPADADDDYECELFETFPAGVRWTTIYSRTDGIVEWQATLDPSATPIEVHATHLGLTASVPSFEAMASALG